MNFHVMILLTLCLCLSVLEGRPSKPESSSKSWLSTELFEAGDYILPLKWMTKFHYYKGNVDDDISEEQAHDLIKEPLKKFKEFYEIDDGTDDLSDAVLKVMEEPRCSQPDDEDDDPTTKSKRPKRYSLLNDGLYLWNDTRTPYPIKIGFKNYWNGSLTPAQQRQAAMTCAQRWSEYANIEFKLAGAGEVANIEVDFRVMDGPFGTIGTGLSPVPFRNPPTSYLRLDKGEQWSLGDRNRDEVSLLAGLCHEMGHTLSLSHSHRKDAIMYPSINPENEKGLLHQDDIDGIVRLYGARKSNPKPPVKKTTTTTTEEPTEAPTPRFRPETQNPRTKKPQTTPSPRTRPMPTRPKISPNPPPTHTTPSRSPSTDDSLRRRLEQIHRRNRYSYRRGNRVSYRPSRGPTYHRYYYRG